MYSACFYVHALCFARWDSFATRNAAPENTGCCRRSRQIIPPLWDTLCGDVEQSKACTTRCMATTMPILSVERIPLQDSPIGVMKSLVICNS